MVEEVPLPKAEIQAFRSRDSFISGGIAGMVTKTIIAPFERVKLIYLTSDIKFKYIDAAKRMYGITAEEGVIGLWRGNSMNMARVFPYTAIVVADNSSNSEHTTGSDIIFLGVIR